MKTPLNESPTIETHQQVPTPQQASEPADAGVADKVGFVKQYRRPLMAIGLLTGGLTLTLIAGGSKPAVKDPRLQSPRVEIFEAEAARAKYTQTKADEARFAVLVETRAVSRQEYDQARAALDSAKAQLDAAEAQARVSNNSSEYAVLLADADGVIVRTLSEPGQVVAAGQTVILLAHDGPREALINLPEGVRPDLGTSASARLYGQNKMYQAKLRQLSDAADPASRTFEARYVLGGEAATAPLGSTVTITLVTEQKPGNKFVRLPVGAVYDPGSGPGVWIVDGKSEVKFRPVTIGSIGQEEVVVSDGIETGEKVVALGAHLLHEGQVVNSGNEGKIANAKF